MLCISERDYQHLEDYLSQRPDRSLLVDRNILREYNVSPVLISATERVVREKRNSSLQHKMSNRPDKDQLISKGIYKNESEGPKRGEVGSHIEAHLQNRPVHNDLVSKHIVPTQTFFTSPHIASIHKKLEVDNQKVFLEKQLLKRPKTREEMEQKKYSTSPDV
ncbi:MKL1 [Acrasis kona]|uniref:MKL1 n=1 Tax=Acrasis kona TaxID=1008807 RepID=A0AAW2ZLZ3_9EUKA